MYYFLIKAWRQIIISLFSNPNTKYKSSFPIKLTKITLRKLLQYRGQIDQDGVDLQNELKNIKDKKRVKEIMDILNQKKNKLKKLYVDKLKTNPIIEVNLENLDFFFKFIFRVNNQK